MRARWKMYWKIDINLSGSGILKEGKQDAAKRSALCLLLTLRERRCTFM